MKLNNFKHIVNDLLCYCSGFLRLLYQRSPKRRRTNRKLRKKVSSHWSVIYVMLRLLQIICELEVWREAFGVKGDNKKIFSSLMCSIRSNLYHCGQKSFSTLNGQEHSGSRVMISQRVYFWFAVQASVCSMWVRILQLLWKIESQIRRTWLPAIILKHAS